MTLLTRDIGERFVELTLSHLGREYPFKMDLVLTGPEDARPPREHHPVFHGSFDWHSCVHGWWQVMRLIRLFPDMSSVPQVRIRADAMLTPANIAGERAYLARAMSAGFERPYGWAWALALHAELERHDAPWSAAVEPLARDFADRFRAFLPKLTYPLRVGTHFNIAFALTLALEWAEERDAALAALIRQKALGWFGQDRACQAWEPGGDEFLSPALCESLLMSRLLDSAAFQAWFHAFLPDLTKGEPVTLFQSAIVSDRSDGKIAHLDGLNLSRAWCWRGIAAALGPGDPVQPIAREAASRHIDASLPHVAGDYMGEHWLATFALLALE
ncbi:MAG: DUF2891 domain-containing protein [Sphingobium sp.]|uniref:DUF2891 domain-containing protein n=1 Tax=Sphingobium sp. TaxID=1912891 RepID=UPI000DB0C6C4|nr:DUF2891 domain-containing protein [Sphingobium sp.]PZU09322.1 MAG: DUF2891 domain-containing protein [Sphingobium sp.]